MKWIDAKVAIPSKPGKYIVYEVLNNRVNHDYWNVPEGSDTFRPFWNHYVNNVTHWMPLPEAPKK